MLFYFWELLHIGKNKDWAIQFRREIANENKQFMENKSWISNAKTTPTVPLIMIWFPKVEKMPGWLTIPRKPRKPELKILKLES